MKPMRYLILCAACVLMMTACHTSDEMNYSTHPVENIEALWQIIDTKYCYVEEKNVDWNEVHDIYIAKAKQLPKNDVVALFDLCAEMLNLLEDGHVNLYSPFDRSYCTAWYDTYPANFYSSLQSLYLRDYRIAGSLYYCTVDNGNIGYVYYSSFSNSVSAGNISWVLKAFKDCKGLIIDVRNNGGGNLTNSYLLSSPFFTENKVVGYWQHKTGPGHHDFSPMEELTSDASLCGAKWSRPAVVLTNRRCYSATNSFINIMRYADHATIVGGTSGGGGGMPMSYELPCGWLVRFSSVRMYDADKNDIEQGIEPDVEVNITSTDKDDIIEKAIELINNNLYD